MGNLLNMSGGSLLGKGLPYDAEIEYLESSGTQYIDTGIIPNISTVMQFKFTNLQTTPDVIIGFIDGNNHNYRLFNYQNKIYFDCFSKRISGNSLNPNILYEFETGNRYVKDLATGNVLISGSAVSVPQDNIIHICLNGHFSCSKNRWYYVKIFQEGSLVFDGIPVRVGNVGYMHDRVSGQLFGNAGTGNFILGNDI